MARSGMRLSDDEAKALKETQYADVDPEAFFLEIVTRVFPLK